MIAYPAIDPVALSLGPVQVHWYGLMYLVAFASAWGTTNIVITKTAKRDQRFSTEQY